MRMTGTMRALDARRGAIRVEDLYATELEDLWDACTQPERLRRWMGEVSGELRVGGAIHASFVSTWTGPGRIDACEPPHHLHLTMEPGSEDETELEAWLTAEGDQTRLVVEERGLPLVQLHLYGAGWQAHLEDLGRALAGQPSAWKERWDELAPAYESASVA